MRRSPLLRLVGALLGALVALFFVYVFAINLFLSTSLFDKVVNGLQHDVAVHYERGWSIVPGRIHARKLSVRGQDSNVEWILRFDQIDFDVSFLGFTKRTFRASNVHANGTTFRLRQRLRTAPTSPKEWEGLPPIEGQPPYSVRPPPEPPREMGPEAPPAEAQAEPRTWAIDISGISSESTPEVWVDRARFEGNAQIRGGFYFKPNRALEIVPTRVAVTHGIVRTASGSVAEGLDGSTLDVTLGRVDLRTAQGADFLHATSLRGDVHASLPDLGALPLHLPRGVTMRGAGRGVAVLRVTSGVLEKGTHVEATAPEVAVDAAGYRATGGLSLAADVAREPTNEHDRLSFHAEMTDFQGWQPGGRGVSNAFLRASRAEATGDSGALQLAHPFSDLHVVVELVDATLPDASTLSRYIPRKTPIAIVGGHGAAHARFEAWLDEGRSTGQVSLQAGDLDLRIAKMRVRGENSVHAEFDSHPLGTRRLEGARLTMDLTNAFLASDAAPNAPLVLVRRARLDVRGSVVDIDDPLRAGEVNISFPAADVLGPNLLRAYVPKGSMLEAGRARFSLQCRVALVDHRARGTLDVQSRDVMLAYRELQFDAGVHAHARVHDWRWESGDLALDGASVAVEGPRIAKRGSVGEPALSLARIVVRASSEHFDFGDPLAKVVLAASFVDGRVRDTSGFEVFLPPGAAAAIESDDGRFGVELRVDVVGHVANGKVWASATRMGMRAKNLHLAGDVNLVADVTGWDINRSAISGLDSRVSMTQVAGRFRARGPSEFGVQRIVVEARSSGFQLERPSLGGADVHLVVQGAELPDARALAALLPPGGAFGIESGSARVGADIAVSAARRTAAGVVDASLTRAAMRLHETRISGDFHLSAGLRGFDPDRGILGLFGTQLEMRDVAVTGASATTSNWGGNVTFTGASFRLAPEPRLAGAIRLDARDARPLLAILFGNGFPKLLVGLTDMPRLTASAWLTVGRNRNALLDIDAHGGDVGLRGSYAIRGAQRRGAVIARKSFLSVGFRLDNDGAHPRLFGLDGWLRDQNRAVMMLLDAPGAR